jgi:hypothetical protein
MFCGTRAALDGVYHAEKSELELHDPMLGRTIAYSYGVVLITRCNCVGHDSIEGRLRVRIDRSPPRGLRFEAFSMDDRKKRGAQKPQPSQHIMKLHLLPSQRWVAGVSRICGRADADREEPFSRKDQTLRGAQLSQQSHVSLPRLGRAP